MTRAYSELTRLLEDVQATKERIESLSTVWQQVRCQERRALWVAQPRKQSEVAESPSLKAATEEKEKQIAILEARLQQIEARVCSGLRYIWIAEFTLTRRLLCRALRNPQLLRKFPLRYRLRLEENTPLQKKGNGAHLQQLQGHSS